MWFGVGRMSFSTKAILSREMCLHSVHCDAQVSYKIPSVKSLIKLGATNLTNHYNINATGNPAIGGLYYMSIMYNVY